MKSSALTIPNSVTSIDDYAFDGCTHLTIKGTKGSAAETYATKNGFTFVVLGNETSLPEADSNIYIDADKKIMPNIVAKTAKVGTGCKVTDQNGNTYTVIVKGDVDGSGAVDSADYLRIKSMFLGSLTPEGEYFTAADADGSSKIDSTDYLRIKSCFLGTVDLYE